MNWIRKIAGLLWIAIGVAAFGLMLYRASVEFGKNPSLDTRIFWFTIVPVFTPIMIGLGLFGWYALRGEYDRKG